MALEIIESCVNCYACEPLCPNGAIYQAKPHFRIDPDKCTECLGESMRTPSAPASARSRGPSSMSWGWHSTRPVP